MVRDVNSALINSEKMSKENKDQAIDTLRNAQEIAMQMFSSLYLSGTAERLFKEINIKINRYNGVHIEPPLPVSDINTSALKFFSHVCLRRQRLDIHIRRDSGDVL